MKKFEFQGDWFTKITLNTFDKNLDNPKYSFRRKDLDKAEYEMEIHDVYDVEPDPSSEQLSTIEFLENDQNQNRILVNLYEYIRDVVYPEYQKYISEEEYPGTFPVLSELDNLKDVIGLDHVIILRFGKEKLVYYNLMFETSLDAERGLGFVMYKDSVVEHGTIGGLGYEKVAEHMGIGYDDYLKYQSKIQTAPTDKFQIASKYNKLKPWQEELNRRFHFSLYKLGDDQKLIDFIESGKISIYRAFESIRPHMLRDKRTFLIDYFKSKGHK